MATSGVITSNLTARDIVTKAMLQLGVLSMGEAPTASEGAHGVSALNLMLKGWQSDGCNLWREYEDTQALTIGTATYTTSPRVLDVMEARFVDAQGTERSLGRWEWGDYVMLPNKASAGLPTCFVLRKERDATTITLWPVPSVATSIKYTAARVIEDVASLNDDLDVPQAWLECVIYGLADRLIDVFGASVDPQTAARVTARAAQLYNQMRDFDRPASVFFS